MLRVFKQCAPIPTGQRFTRIGYDGSVLSDEWHAANLREIGVVSSWEEAKKLTTAPIVESVADQRNA